MTHLVCETFLKGIFIVLLTSCATETVVNPVGVTNTDNLTKAPTVSFPGDALDQPSADSAKPPYSTNYQAFVLTGAYSHSPALLSFIKYMVHRHGFSETYLNGLFSRANRLESVIKLESPEPPVIGPTKPTVGSWTRYRNKFLTDDHINNGVEFWRNHAEIIQRASVTYGVDPEYIVGIIGVETYFGRNFGKTRIFDALTTLSFDTERRSKYFMSELESFLIMARDEHFDPLKPQGSWAGAMGYGQFMPSNFKTLAVDFNKDGKRDLWHPHDALGSVAHYFSKSGWQLHQPVTSRASFSKDPTVIELSTYEGSEFWQIYPNFKVIKKYNNSNKYAMAVHQLAQAIKARYQ